MWDTKTQVQGRNFLILADVTSEALPLRLILILSEYLTLAERGN